jgi:hypothetical protein
MALATDGRDEEPLALITRRRGRSRPAVGRPPGGSLDGSVISIRTMEVEARQGFLGAPFRLWWRGRVRWSSPVPHGGEGQARPSSAAWSCLRRAPLPGPSMERSGAASGAQSHIDDRAPGGGHAVSRAVRWLRPSWLSLPPPARGNGSPRRAGRRTPGGALFWPRRRGRCCDHGARRCGGSRP